MKESPCAETQILASLERVRPRLKHLLARYRMGREDGEDLAQDLAIIALRQAGGIEKLEPWLLGVARNLCRMHFRRKLRREEPALDETPEPSVPHDEDRWIARVDFDRSLARLPPRQGEVLRLVAEGYEKREAAERVGYSSKGIRKLIARNVARLAGRSGRDPQGISTNPKVRHDSAP